MNVVVNITLVYTKINLITHMVIFKVTNDDALNIIKIDVIKLMITFGPTCPTSGWDQHQPRDHR